MRNEYRILQDGIAVATATCPREIAHYIEVYRQDGPLEVQARNAKGRWVKWGLQAEGTER